MPITRCPQCHLLLTPQEAAGGKCPDCGVLLPAAHVPPVVVPIVPKPAAAVPLAAPVAPLARSHLTHWVPAAALLLLGLGAGVVCFPLLTALAGPAPSALPDGPLTQVAAAPPIHDNPVPTAYADIKPPSPSPTVAGPTKQEERPAAVQARGAAAPNPPAAPAGATVLRIDRPGLPYVVEPLGHAAEVKLTGKVKTLVVGRIDGHSVLDASKLEAKRIILSDKIGDGSVIKLNAPNGIVEIRSRVEGRSELEINAPNGTVTFAAPYEGLQGASVGGDSEAAVTARVVDFQGAVEGAQTKVLVTFTKGGVLRFQEIAGASHLCYRKSDPSDPDPSVERGRITGNAELKKVE